MNLIFIEDKKDDGYHMVYPGSLTDKPRQVFMDPFSEGNYAGDALLVDCHYVSGLEDCKDLEKRFKSQLEKIQEKLKISPKDMHWNIRLKYTKYYISEVQKYAMQLRLHLCLEELAQ